MFQAQNVTFKLFESRKTLAFIGLLIVFSVPPNLKFEIDDLEEDWTWSRPFSYIHSRVMTGAVNDWDVYLRKIYK